MNIPGVAFSRAGDLLERRFDSWSCFVDYSASTPENLRDSGWGTGHKKFEKFSGTGDYETARVLAVNGWSDGEKLAREWANRLYTDVSRKTEKPVPIQDVEGEEFDIGAVLAGVPEPWTRWTTELVALNGSVRPVVKIVLNGTASYAVGQQTIIRRGAAVLGLCELLELSGRSVEIVLIFSTHDKKSTLYDYISVKRAGQPLDVPRVAFALAHPASLRRIWFSALEHLEKPSDRDAFHVTGDKGTTIDAEKKERGDIYIGRAYTGVDNNEGAPDWNDAEAVEKWIIETLSAQGVRLRDRAAA